MKFEVKVQYRAIDDDGKDKVKSTTVLVETETFGDAEEKAYKAFEGFTEVVVKAIKVSKINEVVSPDREGTFFECGIQFVSIDDVSGKVKQVKHIVLIQSENNDEASKILKEHLAQSMIDHEVVRVAFSPITEII